MLNESRIDFDGVIFDFDNTLVDTASAINDAYTLVFSKIAEDFSVDKKKLLEEATNFQAEKMKELATLKKSYNHADWIPDIAFRMSIRLDDKAEEYKKMFYSYVINNPKFSNETRLLLEDLKGKGKKLALLSERDSVPGMKMERMKKVPFFSCFDEVVIAGETIPFKKIDGAESFLATANIMGFKPNRLIMVGDRLDLDIQNAKEAGMKAILFTGYSNSHEFTKYSPDLVANGMGDLRKLLFE